MLLGTGMGRLGVVIGGRVPPTPIQIIEASKVLEKEGWWYDLVEGKWIPVLEGKPLNPEMKGWEADGT